MNERIAKLYDQSIIIEDGGDYVCGELDPEKFAELIIRECANELLKWRQEPFPLDADSAVRIIKQHFGIEE